MSKERLEEARLMTEMLRVETRLPHDFPFDLVDWLVEQAGRVQELEKENKRLEDFIETIQNVHFVELQREKAENRRYREVLERIARINIEQGTVTISEVQAVLLARKALEGEK